MKDPSKNGKSRETGAQATTRKHLVYKDETLTLLLNVVLRNTKVFDNMKMIFPSTNGLELYNEEVVVTRLKELFTDSFSL